MVNWNPYLESICAKYAQWWQVYTLTDVESRQRIEVEAPPLLDFIVETVQPDKGEPSQKQEKIERLGVLSGLRKYAKESVLLVGRPGTGKSTALARLLLESAQKCREVLEQGSVGAESRQAKIPVLVELRYYKTSLLGLIRSFFKQHGVLLEEAEIEKLLFEQRFELLIDGLNELPSEAARQDLIVFRRENATTPMIFTTRDLGVGGDLGITKKLQMQQLTESQMRDFVKRYLPEQGEQMLRQLGDRLREFGQTPLLLMMLCSVFKAKGSVPPNLGLVFRQFTQIYNDKLKQDVAVTDESRRWWRRLLEHLALKMTLGREPTDLQVAIPRQQAEEILTEFLQQEKFDKPRDHALRWLQDLLNHHLIQLGAEDKIEFRHQLIQEYYTAESLLKQLPQMSDDKLKRQYLNYLKWTEPLVLMLEMVEQEEQALRVVKLALEVDFRLAARLAGAVNPGFQEKTVALVAKLEIPQKVKVELVGITRSINAIALLRQALNDEDSDVRLTAAETLGNIGNEAAVNALIQALNDEDSDVRLRAAEALGKIGNEVAVTALVQVLNDEDYNVNLTAIFALETIGNEVAVTALGQALNLKNYAVDIMPLFALENIGDKVALAALEQALNHEDFNVCCGAADVLGNIGNEVAVAALVQALNHKHSYVRWRVADVLGNIGNEVAVIALGQAFNHKHSYVRWSAAEALGNIGNEAAVTALVQALNDEVSYVRSRAAEALGNIGNEAAVTALVQALNDEVSYVRSRAAEALGNIGNEAAVTALVQALNHKDYSLRSRAAEALGNIGNEVVVTALVQALNDEVSYVRSTAAEVLGKIGNEAAVTALVQALNHEDFDVRFTAAGALDNIGNEVAVTALVQALNDEYYLVRSRAAEVLGKIGNEAAVTALVQVLNDEVSYVRSRAAYALGNIGGEAAVTALVQALNDEVFDVRSRAAYALGNIASFELLPYFFKLLQTTGESYLLYTISTIQQRCQYYNYTLTQPDIPPARPILISLMHILHLSDLHFGTSENAQQWCTQLAADLRRELNCAHLDAVILSGDIANKSTPEEYDAAKVFIDKLITAFQIESDRIVIVPGNHDLNWGLAKQAYTLMDHQDYQGELQEGCYIPVSDDVIRVRDENNYKQRFAHFSKFYHDIKGEPYPLEYKQQGILHHLPEQNLLILGLNSAWQLDHHYKSRASIHPLALSNALEKIDENYTTYEKCLKIAVWHHPLDSAFADRITDQGFMEQLAVAGFRLFLHGHIHKAETSLYRYDLSTGGRKLDRICAGTFGAPVREWVTGYPLQYNLLKLEDKTMTVCTRRREELNGAWKPDARWTQGAGKDPLPRYEIKL